MKITVCLEFTNHWSIRQRQEMLYAAQQDREYSIGAILEFAKPLLRMISQQSTPLQLLLVDSDSVFRQGLSGSLRQYPEIQSILEASSRVEALNILAQAFEVNPLKPLELNLIILSLDPTPETPNEDGLSLCRTIHDRYPSLPILTISTTPEPALLLAAFQAGVLGYCQKKTVAADFITIVRQVAAGYSYWNQGMESIVRVVSGSEAPSQTGELSIKSTANRPLAIVRRNVRQSGLNQIDQAIAQINAQLTHPTLSAIDQLFLTGRRRELRAARWVVNQLLGTSSERPGADFSQSFEPSAQPNQSLPLQSSDSPPQRTPESAEPTPMDATLVMQSETTAIRSIQAALLDATFAKLQFNLPNLTDIPLEIDILRDDKKRELLSLVLRKLEDTLDDLRFSQVGLLQIPDKRLMVLQEVWRTTTIDFFGRYYSLPIGNSPADRLLQAPVEMVDILLQDADVVQEEILNKIPLMSDFLAHLLFQTPLMIDDATYTAGTVEAMTRMEMILQNLMIQIANAVLQPLLNRFGNVVAIKQNFYDRRLLSTREIERFRNNLSWKYRVEKYFKEPTAIFESRYELFVLQEQGIEKRSIYFPRNEEMDELGGIRLAVTLALETRDAIAPRFKTAISFVGSGVVYFLTEVIGRGIGLIGRGILKGVGNVVQETKFNRNSQRSR